MYTPTRSVPFEGRIGWTSRLLPGLLAALIVTAGCQVQPTTPPTDAADTTMAEATMAQTPVERGQYLVATGGCDDCHTPMQMGPDGPFQDMTRRLSGHPESMQLPPPPPPSGPWIWVGSATNTAYAGPWGITYSPNLTPDSTTGIGGWTQEHFVSALKTGKHMGVGRPIMPPMPWHAYSQMPEEDLQAIYAYLRTLPPVKNQVPAYQPPAQ